MERMSLPPSLSSGHIPRPWRHRPHPPPPCRLLRSLWPAGPPRLKPPPWDCIAPGMSADPSCGLTPHLCALTRASPACSRKAIQPGACSFSDASASPAWAEGGEDPRIAEMASLRHLGGKEVDLCPETTCCLSWTVFSLSSCCQVAWYSRGVNLMGLKSPWFITNCVAVGKLSDSSESVCSSEKWGAVTSGGNDEDQVR